MRRGLSLLFASLCLLMLTLGSSPAQAADSEICDPDQTFTVASGQRYTIDLSECSGFGLQDTYTPPAHGTITGLDYNGSGIAFYTNNGDGATSDSFTLKDEASKDIRFIVTILPSASPITVSPASLPAPVIGTPYNVQMSATGGVAPYSYTTTDTLPDGLSLSASGIISGTPRASDSFDFVVNITDSTAGTPLTTTKNYAVTINFADLIISGDTPPQGVVSQDYNHQFSTSGGTPPYRYDVESGTIPPGTTLSQAGLLSGTPSATGDYAFVLKSTDVTGGRGPYNKTLPFTVKITAALQPPVAGPLNVTLQANSIGNPLTLNLGGGAPTSVAVLTNAINGVATASGNSITFTPNTGFVGSDSFTYTATNGAGTSSPGTVNLTVNAAAPRPPTIGAVTAGNAQASVSFTPPTNNGGSSITSYTVTSTPGNFTSSGPGSPITVAGLANNTVYTFTVTATNAIGTSNPSATSNAVTPKALAVITGISPSRGPVAGGTSVTITGSGFLSASSVMFGANSGINITASNDNEMTADSPPGTAGTVDITVMTPAGASATSGADQFTYVAVPVVSSLSKTSGITSGGTTVIITGSGFTSATSVTFGPTNASGFTVNSATQITATSPAGTGTVDVRVTTAGGTSATSGADQFTYVTGPVVTGVSPSSGPTTGGTPVTVTGTGFTGVTMITFGGFSGTQATVVNPTTITVTSPAGTGMVDVQVTTGVGTSPVSAGDKFTYIPPPVVTSVSPTGGPTAGGTSVTINGSGFTGATAVTFGGTAATGVTVNSANQITATAPAGTGTVDVQVTTSVGTSAVNPGDLYTYFAAPTVSSISPETGPTGGGTSVVITGTGLSDVMLVSFGSAPASSFTVNSPTKITATAPAGTGTVDIKVTTAGGISATSAADQYTYVGAPAVSSISPTSGPGTGGTSVTINGSGFTGATAVTFGGTAATGVTVNSANQITATSPAGTGTVDVQVTTPGGTSATSAGDQFTYIGAPTVSGISLTSGPAIGGTAVVITGSGFGTTMAVTFGNTAAASYTVSSNTQIIATSPPGTGTVDVRVSTLGGTSATSTADQYTYINAPTVSSLAPEFGPTSGGNSVTINGTGLTGATAVSFGPTPAAAFTVNSATQITATAPPGTGTVDLKVITAGGTSAAAQYTFADVAVGAVSETVAYGSANNAIALDLKGGSPTSVAVASAPAHGSAAASGTNITYTPTAGFAGSDTFTYTATKGGITSAPATVSITVSPPTQGVTPSGSWAATRGVFYTQTLTWSGGTAPYSNYAALGLPSGLSLSNPTATTAVISGIPTQAGSFSVTASARDSSTGDGPFTHPATFTLTVSAAAALTLSPGATTFNATSGTAFSQTFTANGGLAPYTFTQNGTLPAGVTWNTATATLTGEPTESGDFPFTITASDNSAGAPETFTQNYTLKVANEIPVAPPQSINSAGPGQPVVINLTSNATGGPFTGANLISMVPANAGTATINTVGAAGARMRMFAAAPGNNYSLRFVPNPDANGLVTLTYTLSNATSTSAPGVITISLSSRSDPSRDAEVQGLINAQANSSRRFASGQISNFQQRLEALHAGNTSSFSNGFTLTSASLQRQRQRQSQTDDPTGIEQWMQIQNAKLQSEQSLRLNPTNKLKNQPTQVLKTDSAGELTPELGNQSANALTSPLAFWTSGTISLGDDSTGKSGQSQEFVTSGLSVGADYRLAPNLTVGLGFGYGHDKTDIGDNGSRSQADSYSLALYGSYRPFESIYLDGVLGYQRLTFDNRRYVTDNAGMVNGDRDGSQVFLSLAAGYEYRQENWMLSPYARLDLANATLDKYRERGDEMFALSYNEQKVKTTSTSLGLRSEYARATGIGILTPSLRVEYQHDFQGAGDAAMRYADVTGDGALYHVKLDALGQDRGVFGLGLGLLTESNLSLNMEYQYTLSSGAQKAQSMLFNLRKPF